MISVDDVQEAKGVFSLSAIFLSISLCGFCLWSLAYFEFLIDLRTCALQNYVLIELNLHLRGPATHCLCFLVVSRSVVLLFSSKLLFLNLSRKLIHKPNKLIMINNNYMFIVNICLM